MPFTNQELPGRQCAARAHYHFDIRLVAVGCHAASLQSFRGQWDLPNARQNVDYFDGRNESLKLAG